MMEEETNVEKNDEESEENEVKNQTFGLYFNRKKVQEKAVWNSLDEIPILSYKPDLSILNGGMDNILIEGENFDCLSSLCEIYPSGFVDVIYIDPPYNTGNTDFRFNDKFVDDDDTFKHSKWLCFMESRLTLAQKLLSDKGVIFISIDERELAQLKLLCDQIFGEGNFISIYPRLTVKGGKTQTPLSTKNIDFILAYGKDIDNVTFNKIANIDDPAFKYEDQYVETRGKFHTKQALDTISLGYVPSLDYPIVHDGITYYPGGTPEKNGWRWTWSKDKYEFALKNDFVVFKNGRIWPKKYLYVSIEKGPNGYYIKNEEKAKNYSQIEFLDNKYSNTNGTMDLQKLGLGNSFNYAKPVSLIKDLLKMSSSKDSVVMDFFAGSGTTAQAVLELNEEDGGNRKFILCTNDENDIMSDVCYPRIKTVLTGFEKDGSKYSDGIPGTIRYFKTDSVKIHAGSDQAKYSLAEKCDGLLCILEDCYDKFSENKKYNVYQNQNKTKTLSVFNDIFDEGSFDDMLEKILQTKSKECVVYYYSVDSFVDPYIEKRVLSKIQNATIKPIPSKIYEVYKDIANNIRRKYDENA